MEVGISFKVFFLYLNIFFHDELFRIYCIGPLLYLNEEVLEKKCRFCPSTCIRVVFLDNTKAFDRINHTILMQIIESLNPTRALHAGSQPSFTAVFNK